MDQDQPDQPAKPKTQRATTSTKNRANSPPPYRSHSAEISIDDLFWQHAMNVAEHHEDDFKHQALPLARIKKVAKMDPEVQNTMISSEVTILFEKACQIFIQELTARAHLVSLSAKRRTISRADVAQAVSRSDMFDFLIDIVPRTERPSASISHTPSAAPSASGSGTRSRSLRTRRHSQRESPAVEEDEEENGGGEEGLEAEEMDEDVAKRRRREESGQEDGGEQAGIRDGQPRGNAGGLDMSAAAAAGVGGYFLAGMGDPTNPFPPGPLGWPAGAFDYPGAPGPIDPSLPAFFPPGPVDPSTGLLQPPPQYRHPRHHPHLDPQLQGHHQHQQR
ncbi:nuclear transcription factor Y, gamma [Rhodotorula toruloides]|uniref:Nuclear transcription factor Y, gamma n=1 Tax=Rhodotorula toruloides TaxID=5286 RepID=A0A511KNA0_RHOTO|nr:nuclear transcription factor Y, gamma [Rhodotorula toruloides]